MFHDDFHPLDEVIHRADINDRVDHEQIQFIMTDVSGGPAWLPEIGLVG